jgi:hypothetical protein
VLLVRAGLLAERLALVQDAQRLLGERGVVAGGRAAPDIALGSLSAASRVAAELERSELVFIEAARDSGATWAQIAAAMGAAGRQTAQKRHTDLTRRFQRPLSVDMHP